MEDEIKKRIDTLSKEINKVFIKDTGYNPKMKEIISPKLPPIQFENLNDNNMQNIENTLFNLSGKDKDSGLSFGNYMKTMTEIYGDMNKTMLTSFDNIKSKMAINMEINSLCANIPQVHYSLERMAEAIVASNEAGKSGINLSFKDIDPNNTEEDYEKYFRPSKNILFAMKNISRMRYDIDTHTKSVIKNCLLYGYQFVSIIPYKEIARDILYKSDRRKDYLNPSLQDIDNHILNEIKSKSGIKKALSESFNSLNNDISTGAYSAYAESAINRRSHEKITWYLDKITNNKFSEYNKKEYGFDTSNENMVLGSYAMLDSFVSKTCYTHDDLCELTDYIDTLDDNEFKSFSESIGVPFGENVNTIYNEYIPSLGINSNIVENTYNDKNKNRRKYDVKGLTGCKIDTLSFNRTIPLFSGDNLMGAFVFDDAQRNPMMSPMMTPNRVYNITCNDALNDRNGLNTAVRDDIKKNLFRDMAIILDRNMDKRFLANNSNLIEDIFNVMKHLDYEFDFSMRFIPKEYLQLFKFGEGKLGTSYLIRLRPLLHEYVLAKNANMLDKHFLEKDQYLYSTKFDNDIDVQKRANKAAPALRMFVPRLADISLPAMANNTINQYLLHNMPLNSESEKYWDFEKIEGMDLSSKDEYIKSLLDQITGMIYAPESIVNPSYNVDYATRFQQTNITTGEKVIEFQKQLINPLVGLATKKIQYDTGDDRIRVEIEFDPPFAVNRNVTLENITQIEAQLALYQTYIENNPNYDEATQQYIMNELRKKSYSDVIDIDIIDRIVEEMKIKKVIGVDNIDNS